jgi:BRCT domain type II-containing protein
MNAKQEMIDSLRDIRYDIIREDYDAVTSKLEKAMHLVQELQNNKIDTEDISQLIAKSSSNIKQGIIDCLRGIEFDIVTGDYKTVELKLASAQLKFLLSSIG